MQQWIYTFMLTALYICPLTSFSIQLGHLSVADPIVGARDIVYEKRDGYAVIEHDILIKKLTTLLSKNTLPRAIILQKLGGGRWFQGIVPFKLADNLPLSNKLAALEAMETWQKNTPVTFIELTAKNKDHYTDYLLFSPIAGRNCSSFVGRQGGEQAIFLSPRCNAMNTAHEIGHALGLWHEQSRADRDRYIKILWENIDERYCYNFNQHIVDGQDVGDYDYQSIMHYTAYAFSKNGQKTIIPLTPNVTIGQRDALSKKDIAAVTSMYTSMPNF